MEPGGRATIRDVALRAGVSVATVSKVLNGRYGVAAATAERVKQVIEELGYEASLVARSLRNVSTNVIGVLVADFEPFSTEVLKGAADAIRPTGFELVVYSAAGHAEQHPGWERRYLSRLSGTLVDGAVLVTPTVTDLEARVPVVTVDPHTGPVSMPMVDADNLNGAKTGVRHLLDLGHRRIAMITGRNDLESAVLREHGYREALADAGIPVQEELVMPGGYHPSIARESARRLLTMPERPTAVFAASDLMALATVDVARELGMDVPGDLSVVGFDDVPESVRVSPPLTTVHQPIHDMGQRALEMLVRLIRGEEVQTHVRLPTRLVVRQSTRAV